MYFIDGYYQLFRLLENNSNTAREKGSQRELKLRYSKIFSSFQVLMILVDFMLF